MKNVRLRRTLATCLISAMLLSLSVFSVPSYALTEGDWTYDVANGEARVYACALTSGNITIPATLGGYPVTKVGYRLFENKTGITGVTIPDGIIAIESYAFNNCTGLTSITIPNSVTSIGLDAFRACSNLTSVKLSDGLTTIEAYVFYNCTGLTSITIPDSVTSINSSAFQFCSNLTSVLLPDGLTTIKGAAFAQCIGLTSVTIPDSVTFLGAGVFYSCSNLTSVNIPNGVTVIQSDLFKDCGKLTSVSIPNGVTSIGGGAFSSSGLTSVMIPNTVTSIGLGAFAFCTNLTTAMIPGSVVDLEQNVFNGCTNLTSVTLHEGIKSIGHGVFINCPNLPSLTIPDSVTSMTSSAIWGCTGLTSVVLGKGIASIPGGCFSNDDAITKVVCRGNAPNIDATAFTDVARANLIIFYDPSTSGWPIGSPTYTSNGKTYKLAPMSALELPAGPTNLSAVGGQNKVDLTWDAATGAQSYTVMYSIASDLSSPTTADFATNSGSITGLLGNTTYYFTVRSNNITGSSTYSGTVNATTLADKYAVIYDANGATSGSVPIDPNSPYEEGETVTVLGNTGNLEKTGFNFNGWYVDGGGSDVFVPGQTFMTGTVPITFSASWIAKDYFTISFDGNGATGGIVPSPQVVLRGSEFTVPENVGGMHKADYAFGGWNTEADGSGDYYWGADVFSSAATFTVTSDLTLYAVWGYRLDYNPNGGEIWPGSLESKNFVSSPNTEQYVDYGIGVDKAPYTFYGWNTAPDGSGTTYGNGSSITMTSNKTLYAIWGAAQTTCKIRSYVSTPIDTTPKTSMTVKKGDIVYLDIDINDCRLVQYSGGTLSARIQYDSNNFNIGTVSGTDYWIDSGLSSTWNVTQFAKGGSGSSSYVDFRIEDSSYIEDYNWSSHVFRLAFVAKETAAAGTYDFKFVASEAGALKTFLMSPSTEFTYPYVTEVYALETSNPQTTHSMTAENAQVKVTARAVNYDANGATSGDVPIDPKSPFYETGETVTVLGNTGNLIKTDLIFAGWNTAANGSGTSYAAGSTFSMGTADVTLYARWTTMDPSLEFALSSGFWTTTISSGGTTYDLIRYGSNTFVTANDFVAAMNITNGYVEIYDKSGTLLISTASGSTATSSTATVSTSVIVKLYISSGGAPVKTYGLVMKGDINGDGALYSNDVTLLKRYTLGTYTLDAYAMAASDINGDGSVYTTDVTLLKRATIGTYTIDQTK